MNTSVAPETLRGLGDTIRFREQNARLCDYCACAGFSTSGLRSLIETDSGRV
ncbi:MAG TPA: hypothetical protein VKG78_03585 [Opitutaceae bacterium]|nr:hypothetical protein [Opitutaceae bacterium]